MRSILFRGKRTYNQEWIYGDLMQVGNMYILDYSDPDEVDYVSVLPETVGQFTGLKDKNGREIYEGDILREPAKNDWDAVNYAAYEVFFHDGDEAYVNIGFQMNRMHFYGSVCGGSLLMSFLPKWTKRLEIIGNIHDLNPAVKDSVTNTMNIDPNATQVPANQEATNEQATNAQESAAQDQAMGVDSEEGSIEG